MIRAMPMLVRYWFKPTVKNWRVLRTHLMKWLPKSEKASDVENDK